MNIKFLDLQKQYQSIKNEIDSGILNEISKCEFINGSYKNIFEANFAKYIGTKYCLGVANGTDALEIAIKALNIPENSEVLIQSNTFIATCLGATYNNLKINFVDINPNTLMIDLDDLVSKINSNTKLIIVVHLYGASCNMDRVVDICNRYDLLLLEDCAQSHGGYYNGKKLGTFGNISCFSFYPGKNLGAYGDGGAICTNNEDHYKYMKKYCNLGSAIKYQHEFIGRNSRLDTIQSVILDIKLKYIDNWNQLRREKVELYKKLLNNNIKIMEIEDKCIPVYHLFVVRVKDRDSLMKYLKDYGIDVLIHYPIPIHKTEAYKEYNNIKLINVDMTSEEILSLPIYAELENNEIEYICDKINKYYQK
jgi:dTDP-4-amino-4,6-dideoxygalactose transaminase